MRSAGTSTRRLLGSTHASSRLPGLSRISRLHAHPTQTAPHPPSPSTLRPGRDRLHQLVHLPRQPLQRQSHKPPLQADADHPVDGAEEGAGADGAVLRRHVGLQFGQWFGDHVHQEEVFVEVPLRCRAGVGGEVVEQGFPEVAVLDGEGEVALGEVAQPIGRALVPGFGERQPGFQRLQRRRVDVDDELGEVGEDGVEAAERAAGVLGDVAGAEIGQPVAGDALARRLDQARLQVFAFFFSSAGH